MSTRVPGHTLVSEGAAYVVDDQERIVRARNDGLGGSGGYGRGYCSCGALSDLLTSGYQRKAWHREHKAHVAATDDTPGGDK